MAQTAPPSSFRSKEKDTITQTLHAGNSCIVIGIGSVGKSNLLRYLHTQAAKDWENSLFAYIDANKLIERTPWGLYELILHQLVIELEKRSVDAEVRQEVALLHQSASTPAMMNMAMRYLDRAITILCSRSGLTLVLLMDDFDELAASLPAQTFAALRAIRDENKTRLMYVVATRRPLNMLRENQNEIESFEELLSDNTLWLGAYNLADGREMLVRIAARYDLTLDDATIQKILTLTGGHPGLIRAVFHLYQEFPHEWESQISMDLRVQDECNRIWMSIPAEDQAALIVLAQQGVNHIKNEAQISLRNKKLVGGDWATKEKIFSQLFLSYLLQKSPPVGAQLSIDRQRRVVNVAGREISGLTRLEYKFVEFLDANRARVCTRDELSRYLYPEETKLEGEGVSETRLDSLVQRVRRGIEPYPDDPRYIQTVRGVGFKLEDGNQG